MKDRVYAATLAVALALAAACSDKQRATAGADENGNPQPTGIASKSDPPHEGGGAEHSEEGHGDEVHADEDHNETISLSPEAARNAGLQLGRSEAKALGTTLTVPARVAFTQQGHARVSSRVPGRLAELPVLAGTQVKKGQALAYVESQALGEARGKYLAAAAKARVAKSNLQREKDLFAKGITSEREMREAEATAATAYADLNAAEASLHALGLGDAQIRALRLEDHYSSRVPVLSPIAGTVVEVLGAVGQSVEPTDSLFVVGDLSELWVLLDVSESQLPQVSAGMPVLITIPARPGQRYEGKVAYVGDVVDPKTRTVPVRVAVPNPDRELKPGMFATAELRPSSDGAAGPASVVVPREAVQKVGNEEMVFVPLSPTQFKPVDVKTGRSTATEIEIVSGLEPGTRVVTQGAFILKSELSKESMGGHGH